MSFPCEESVHFPSRKLTLNYFDDTTHTGNPPVFDDVLNTLERNGFYLLYSTRSYQPLALSVLGFLQEPLSRAINNNMQGTWAYYGFESIIWATKL